MSTRPTRPNGGGGGIVGGVGGVGGRGNMTSPATGKGVAGGGRRCSGRRSLQQGSPSGRGCFIRTHSGNEPLTMIAMMFQSQWASLE